jgi:hypothetical protein
MATKYEYHAKVISTVTGAKGKVLSQASNNTRTLVRWSATRKEEWVATHTLDPRL